MMPSLPWLLRVAVVIGVALAAAGVPARVNLVALGLCCFSLSSVI